MSILDNIARTLGYTKTQPIQRPTSWQLAQAAGELYSVPEITLPQAQAELYQRLTWVQMAVHAVASMAATSALNVKRLEGEDEVDIPNHPFETLLGAPNPLQSRYEFLESIFAYRALTGNAYVWLNRTSANRPPSEMWVIPPHSIKPVPDERMYLRGYIYTNSAGEDIPLDLWEIAHFKRFHPLNSFVGLSPVEALATVAVGDMAMSKWNTNFFDKDNAKVPGLLAFADPVPDADWQRLKDDINSQHGGTKRRMMMLRNVGKGGVEWVSTAMSQSDMQFLQAREANRSEIFGMFAPGLDSVLAINATEANALAGKRTFVELAVWPQMVAVAEKITNDILPAYGSKLKAEFEDIRVTDRALELQEQAAFAQVATVDEIRQKFYQLDPIGDDRGLLLPVQVTAAQAAPPEEPLQPGDMSVVADNGPQTAPQTATDDTTQSADEVDAEKAADLRRFRRWASKRTNPDPDAFKSVHLSYTEKAAILYDLLTEDGDADTMPPFTLTDGRITPEWVKSAKAMILQLDPDDDEAEQKIRMQIERRMERDIRRALDADREKVISSAAGLNQDNFPEWAARDLEEALARRPTEDEMYDLLRQSLRQSADLGVSVAVEQFETIGLGFDWTLANQAAAEWVNGYTATLYDQINTTTRKKVRTSVREWVENGQPLDALVDELAPIFGRQRAQLIASTEVTRAYAQGNREAYLRSGVVTRWEWRTAHDERVCPICGPLHKTVVRIDSDFSGFLPDEVRNTGNITAPPAHPRCRCWIVPVVEGNR